MAQRQKSIHSHRLGGGSDDLARARVVIWERLEARRSEIENALLTRVYAITDPSDADPVYLAGLRDAVSIALDYALEAIERGEDRTPPPPPTLRAQARMAARSGIGLDTVLRRYFAGYAVLGEFLNAEGADQLLPDGTPASRLLLAPTAAIFDRLLAAVSEEYAREQESSPNSYEQRQTERIERLLAGEVIDTSRIGYDFDVHHIGLIVSGHGAEEVLRRMAAETDHRLLLVCRGEERAWAWLGSRRAREASEIERYCAANVDARITVSLGEPATGLEGWRHTYRQAAAALPIALRRPQAVTRYADVAVLTTMLHDDVLLTSLQQMYLSRLDDLRGDGEAARQTLRAYFAADCNVSSAAAALGVTRHTVSSRLRAIEERFGRPLSTCRLEVDAALHLERLGGSVFPHALVSRS